MLEFHEIDVDRDRETCVQFRADSFAESFGSTDEFFRYAGPQGWSYLEGLRTKMQDWPGSCVHGWHADEIVGQIELRRDRTDRAYAHVLLYYLRPDARGRGFGDDLDTYVARFLREAGVRRATLRVSPTNLRAMAYYRKHGWRDRGPDPEHASVHVMERGADAS
jgi:ribosomal protein S18 acetylase RimI-like enzyme